MTTAKWLLCILKRNSACLEYYVHETSSFKALRLVTVISINADDSEACSYYKPKEAGLGPELLYSTNA